MTVSAATLCQSGISYPVAIEMARQLNAGPSGNTVASVNQLIASGVNGTAATELVKQITAQVVTTSKLIAAGLPHEVSTQIKKTSGL